MYVDGAIITILLLLNLAPDAVGVIRHHDNKKLYMLN